MKKPSNAKFDAMYARAGREASRQVYRRACVAVGIDAATGANSTRNVAPRNALQGPVGESELFKLTRPESGTWQKLQPDQRTPFDDDLDAMDEGWSTRAEREHEHSESHRDREADEDGDPYTCTDCGCAFRSDEDDPTCPECDGEDVETSAKPRNAFDRKSLHRALDALMAKQKRSRSKDARSIGYDTPHAVAFDADEIAAARINDKPPTTDIVSDYLHPDMKVSEAIPVLAKGLGRKQTEAFGTGLWAGLRSYLGNMDPETRIRDCNPHTLAGLMTRLEQNLA